MLVKTLLQLLEDGMCGFCTGLVLLDQTELAFHVQCIDLSEAAHEGALGCWHEILLFYKAEEVHNDSLALLQREDLLNIDGTL